ncbi:DUF2254 domain-containing protein [Nitratireductor sp. B36]|uniref:DUF2254 domain-containing protein n=1 Tax=Nitratireductor sp. B36 TaxID=2762059 RepID=UPI001E48A97E|nr:DUF2254 domain-containing protein [Nitratireductor sp. B36]
MNGYWFLFRRFSRALWFLPALFCVSALIVVALAYLSAGFFPEGLEESAIPITVSADALRNILSIVASSMLTVAVFALSTLVNLLTSAAQTGSPRAVPLFSGNRAARTTISVFIGAFLFSIIGIIGLSSGIYTLGGRLILFIATLFVVFAVVWALIRWVREISVVGRVVEMTSRLEDATLQALNRLGRDGLYGCSEGEGAPIGHEVAAGSVGFVQHFDPHALQDLAEDKGLVIHVRVRPGDYVDHAAIIAVVVGEADEAVLNAIRGDFIIGEERTFDSDPGFGFLVLADVARRALSPGVNDPSTANHVLTVQTRLLANWARKEKEEERKDPPYPRIRFVPVSPERLLDEAFRPISYEAASAAPDVQQALVRGLTSLARVSPDAFERAAATLAKDFMARAGSEGSHEPDIVALRKLAAGLTGGTERPRPSTSSG